MPLSAAPAPTPAPASTPERVLRVHVVEDDADLREDMLLLLHSAGFEVHGQEGAEAFFRAQALSPCDVAVLDIGLRGEDGLSIASQLRASGPIGIVMASARGSVEDRVEALRLGADAYMVKPIHIEELVATIHRLGSRVRAMSGALAPAPLPVPLSVPLHAPAEPADADADTAPRWHLAEGGWFLCAPQGQRMKLTTNERAFLGLLLDARGAIVEREALMDRLFAFEPEADPRRLSVIASRLRRKAAQEGMALPLHVARRSGYQFVAARPATATATATPEPPPMPVSMPMP